MRLATASKPNTRREESITPVKCATKPERTRMKKSEVYLPVGRTHDYIATLTEDECQRTATKSGMHIGDNDTIKMFKTRVAMARLIRKEEKNAPFSSWRPV